MSESQPPSADIDAHGLVEFECTDGVAIVRLNRPDRLNALNDAMKDRLGDLFEAINRKPEVRAVVLCAAGRAFCASGDVTTMGRFTVESARERLRRAHRMIIALARIEVPVIAAVQGAVAGIGWSMALACDFVYAAPSAYFSQVFKNVGLAPDGGAAYFLAQNLGVLRAKELVFSGRKLGAEEAHGCGLVTRVLPEETLYGRAVDDARRIAAGPTLAFGIGKKMFTHVYTPSLDTFLDAEMWAQANALLTDDHAEGVTAFLEKRRPVFKGR